MKKIIYICLLLALPLSIMAQETVEYTKKQGEYIASLPIEDLESLIRAWLEKSNYTVEVLEELFMELCPEYYESTIKYILEKYK